MPKRTTSERGKSASRSRSAGSRATPKPASIMFTVNLAYCACPAPIMRRVGNKPYAAATGLDRPRAAAVNVFFAFARSPTYQCAAACLCRHGIAMPNLSVSDASSLADLRVEIDRLIRVKQTQESGSAFRPAREAEMMRRLLERHKGILPLDTAESIWRVIIATFTFVQAPFSVHADLSAGEAMMRDSARFHFGFTVPFVPHLGANGVVAAVSGSKGDLALVPAFDIAGAGAWWTALEFDAAPKIIARLPFLERSDHPAGLPVFVVSRAAPDAMATEVEVWSVR